MPVEQQEIHIKQATGIASASGWWAKYHYITDPERMMCLPLACWTLLQTRATKVEVPNTPSIPVVMGMIAREGQLGLHHAPAVPDWAFQAYITDDEHDDFLVKQNSKEEFTQEVLKKEDKRYGH